MQVYRGMDIGTAKPTRAQRAEVRHHLVDVADPSEEYTVARFQRDVDDAVAEIENRGHRAVLVGGTGLYVRAVVDRLDIPGRFPDVRAEIEAESDTARLHAQLSLLDPVAASRMNATNRRRIVRALEVTRGSGRPFSSYGPGLDTFPPTPWMLIGIDRPRDVLDHRIEDRYRTQLDAGLIDEVRALADRPEGLSGTARQALGYKELLAHIEGCCTLEDALATAVVRTRRFARRQQRWFRRDPRIGWLDLTEDVDDADEGHNALSVLEVILGD